MFISDRERDPGVEAAIAAAGSSRKLAKLLGISHSAVSGWVKIPVHHVLTLEKKLKIPRHELRHDIYPRPRLGRPRTPYPPTT